MDEYKQDWAQKMAQSLLDIKAEVEEANPHRMSLSPERTAHFERCCDEMIAEGLAANPPPATLPPKKWGRKKQSPPKNLLDRECACLVPPACAHTCPAKRSGAGGASDSASATGCRAKPAEGIQYSAAALTEMCFSNTTSG